MILVLPEVTSSFSGLLQSKNAGPPIQVIENSQTTTAKHENKCKLFLGVGPLCDCQVAHLEISVFFLSDTWKLQKIC